MKMLNTKCVALIAAMATMACLAWGGQLTEESIRELLKTRCEAFEKGDAETIVALHTTNAVISASFFGMPIETTGIDPREFGESFSKEMPCIFFRTDPIKIEIADGEAVVKEYITD